MFRALLVNSSSVLAVASDPISAILNRDWAGAGGWGLFTGLVMLIVVGSFREWWVPGGRYQRLEAAAIKSSDALAVALKQNEELIKSNEISKYFFQQLPPPKRGDKRRDLE